MKRIVGFVLFIGLICLAGVPSAVGEEAQAPYVTPAEVKGWKDAGKDVIFLDVREADEFEAGHLPEAINVPYMEVPAMADRLPKDRPVVTYCIHSAHRAPEAAKALRGRGFDNAYVLEGGIVAWQAGGMTLRASDLAKEPTILPVSERCKPAPGHAA